MLEICVVAVREVKVTVITEPVLEVGYDYAQAVRELNRVYTQEQIAELCGWKDRSAVRKIRDGAEPSHSRGESLYYLYTDTFHAKPPRRNVDRRAQTVST